MAELIPNTEPFICGGDDTHMGQLVENSADGASNSDREPSSSLGPVRQSHGANAVPASSLADLIGFINGLNKGVSFEEMAPLLKTLNLNDEDIRNLFIPDRGTYSRSSVCKNRFAELVALTWLPGQASPIHDHGDSACGVRVITGTALETRFVPIGDDVAAPIESLVHGAGVVFGGGGSEDLHIVANNSQVSTLRTIHLYSPPLPKEAMKIFREFFPNSQAPKAQSAETNGAISQ